MTGFLKRLFGGGRKGPLDYEQAKELAAHPDSKIRAELAARDDVKAEILYFLSEDTDSEVRRQVAANPNAPAQEPPDVIVDGKIDLGALTAEALALALDPYPKKPGVAFVDVMEPEDLSESPFAALARLKGQGGPEGGKV